MEVDSGRCKLLQVMNARVNMPIPLSLSFSLLSLFVSLSLCLFVSLSLSLFLFLSLSLRCSFISSYCLFALYSFCLSSDDVHGQDAPARGIAARFFL